MQDALYQDLSDAQKRVLDAIVEARAPIVIEGERRYTLEGAKLHYATVEALERRGCLVRESGRMVIAEPAAELTAEPPTERSDDELDSLERKADTEPASRPDFSELLLDEDVGVRARQSLKRRSNPSRKDESLFGWLYRRLEGLFS